jgi:hypothetical protein
MVEKARSHFDWRRYVAGHPWTSLGAAAMVGYYLIPRRTRCPIVDSATFQEAVERMASVPKPQPQSAVSGIVLRSRPSGSLIVNAPNGIQQAVRNAFDTEARAPFERNRRACRANTTGTMSSAIRCVDSPIWIDIVPGPRSGSRLGT